MATVTKLHDDAHLLIVNKLIPVSTQSNSDRSLALIIRTEQLWNGRLYDVHRIDTPVTGAVVYAKTRRAARDLSQQFASATVTKTYLAAVEHELPEQSGRLEHYLIHRQTDNRSVCVSSSRTGARRCVCTYRTLGSSDRYYFVELTPETGRTHQLRAQLAAIGCPAKGDQKYGARRGNSNRLIHLHARSVSFHHPDSGSPMTVLAPLPEDPVWNAFPIENSPSASR